MSRYKKWPKGDVPEPKPEDIRILREEKFKQTQGELARRLGYIGKYAANKVNDLEKGRRDMDFYRWHWFLVTNGLHPKYGEKKEEAE